MKEVVGPGTKDVVGPRREQGHRNQEVLQRTPTECWQKTSDLHKGKKLPPYLDRAKEKRNNRDKRIGTAPAPVGGSCEGGKISTH